MIDVLENQPRITKQWDIPNYQDPWLSSNAKVESYRERAKAGLTVPMAKTVYCYDTQTGEYSDYPSKLQCADKIDIALNTVKKGIKQGKGVGNRYFLAVSKTRLAEIIKINKMMQGENVPIKILCIDTLDNTSVVYKSKSEASKQIGYSEKSVTWALSKGNLINGRYKVEVSR